MSRVLLILMLLMIIWMAILVSSCAFEPVRIEGIPEECNMAYSVMKLSNKMDDKSIAVVPMNKCMAVLQRDRCRDEVYGKGNSVNYSDAKKYRDYAECLKELEN